MLSFTSEKKCFPSELGFDSCNIDYTRTLQYFAQTPSSLIEKLNKNSTTVTQSGTAIQQNKEDYGYREHCSV